MIRPRRGNQHREIEALLHRARPAPDASLLRTLAADVRAAGRKRTSRAVAPPGLGGLRARTVRLGLAALITATILSPLAAFGELNRAPATVEHAAGAFAQIVNIAKRSAPPRGPAPAAAANQYRPPPTCRGKAKARYRARVAAARRAHAARIRAARKRLHDKLRRCRKAGCRRAAQKAHATAVARATRALKLALKRAQATYKRELTRCHHGPSHHRPSHHGRKR